MSMSVVTVMSNILLLYSEEDILNPEVLRHLTARSRVCQIACSTIPSKSDVATSTIAVLEAALLVSWRNECASGELADAKAIVIRSAAEKNFMFANEASEEMTDEKIGNGSRGNYF